MLKKMMVVNVLVILLQKIKNSSFKRVLKLVIIYRQILKLRTPFGVTLVFGASVCTIKN
jgi:hypothetical protein